MSSRPSSPSFSQLDDDEASLDRYVAHPAIVTHSRQGGPHHAAMSQGFERQASPGVITSSSQGSSLCGYTLPAIRWRSPGAIHETYGTEMSDRQSLPSINKLGLLKQLTARSTVTQSRLEGPRHTIGVTKHRISSQRHYPDGASSATPSSDTERRLRVEDSATSHPDPACSYPASTRDDRSNAAREPPVSAKRRRVSADPKSTPSSLDTNPVTQRTQSTPQSGSNAPFSRLACDVEPQPRMRGRNADRTFLPLDGKTANRVIRALIDGRESDEYALRRGPWYRMMRELYPQEILTHDFSEGLLKKVRDKAEDDDKSHDIIKHFLGRGSISKKNRVYFDEFAPEWTIETLRAEIRKSGSNSEFRRAFAEYISACIAEDRENQSSGMNR